jgi:N-methylhydantoinase A/oxoprolinase/acetone carboxylase beta subunit
MIIVLDHNNLFYIINNYLSLTMNTNKTFRFSIDRGGTFTDVYAEVLQVSPDSEDPGDGTVFVTQRVLKLLSVDPNNYPDAPREGIRRILEAETGIPHPRHVPLDTSRIRSIRMGTTVRHGLIITDNQMCDIIEMHYAYCSRLRPTLC